MKILIAETRDFSLEVLQELKSFADVHLYDINKDQIVNALQEYDVFWFRLGFKLDASVILLASTCKYIVCPATGIDHIDLEACKLKGIVVISLRGEYEFLRSIRATAELTLGLTLSMLRNIHSSINHTRQLSWDRTLFKGREIFNKKVGILGFGRLGKLTASYFHSLGADVYVYDIETVQSDSYNVVDSIDSLFQVSDIISVHVNLTKENEYLIQSAHFEQMKIGSYFVNTSRGQLVRSRDLILAIESGILASAAVDVIENEYDIERDELLNFAAKDSRLLITPHIGGNTYESFLRTEKFMVNKLRSVLNI